MKRRWSMIPLLVLAGVLNAVENAPVVMDLRLGQPQEIGVAGPAGEIRRSIRLLAVRHHHWPNWHLADAPNHQIYQSAEVEVEVDGTRATLWARPFEAPQLVNGLRLYVETIPPKLTNGVVVKAGEVLGRTGMTWAGRRSQDNDPHLHWGVSTRGRTLGSFPYLLEAYLRDYPDAILAVAGGYQYAMPGDLVVLDASRTVARPGRRVARYRWLLHDGREVEGAHATVRAGKPGLYSEELRVWADDGSEDRDYVQLRVWDVERGGRVGAGWFYHSPVRGARAGSPICFWNRLGGTTAPVSIDFGDGSPLTTIDRELSHAYATPGVFTAKLLSRGPGDEPVELRMRVVIE